MPLTLSHWELNWELNTLNNWEENDNLVWGHGVLPGENHVIIKNNNYGYTVTTHGGYIATGNPSLEQYRIQTSGLVLTGSVDVFKFNLNLDKHDLVETLYRPFAVTGPVLLAAEDSNILHTEDLGYDIVNRDKDIAVDIEGYITRFEDAYGTALDFHEDTLAVGCKYYWDQVDFPGGSVTLDSSGSCVDIWDYSYAERDQFVVTEQPRTVGFGLVVGGTLTGTTGYTGSLDFKGYDTGSNDVFFVNILVPPGWNEVWVYGSTTGTYSVVSKIPVSVEGQYTTFFYSLSLPSLTVFSRGYLITEPTRFRINNPDVDFSSSFGYSVSLNQEWLAIGSPEVSSSTGMVYLYKNETVGNTLSWSLYQKIEPSSGWEGNQFGHAVSLNKGVSLETQYGDSNRLVVGGGATTSDYVYVYELSGSEWIETYKLNQITDSLYPLPFDPESYPILHASSYQSSSFGFSVSTYEDTVIIGAPTDRTIYEYSGSSLYPQGAVYIFEKCPPPSEKYYLNLKSYGNDKTLKTNRFGHSVGVYGNNIAVGLPKANLYSITSCYIQGSLQLHSYCGVPIKDDLHGQWVYFTKNTSSFDWDISKVFQKKKKHLSPYKSFGAAVSVGDFSIVVGAPMLLSDLNRGINIPETSSLDDIAGKSYIYNLHNYKNQFYVGNAFYRDGKLVINTSGSAFEGIYFNPVSPYTYEYQLGYKSKQTLFEKQIICTVEPGEFNVSTNPTAIVKSTASFDINKNNSFDFQDADILLRYMKYKASRQNGVTSFNWSSSVLQTSEEISYYNYNASCWDNTDFLFSSSLKRFENVDTWMASTLDFNQDNKIDQNDILILWKYISNRLTQENYSSYINPNCTRQTVTDALTYMDNLSLRRGVPKILPEFLEYDELTSHDPTGSYLSPFVTTIGLYDGLDLVAVAKLGTPIKLPKTLPINFVTKMDF